MYRKIHTPLVALIAALILCAKPVSAATIVDMQRLDINQINRNYQANSSKLALAKTPNQRHAQMLMSEPNSTLTLIKNSQDKAGRHYRYQQSFRGLPIFGKQVVVSETIAGDVRALFGNKVVNLSEDLPTTSTKLSSLEASHIAKRAWLGKRISAAKVEDETVRKMIYIDRKNRAHVTYIVSFFANNLKGNSPTEPVIVVDANSGRIIDKWEALATALIGTGPGGNLKTLQYEYGTTPNYGYLDVAKSGTTCIMRNTKVRTLNFNNATSGGVVHTFPCSRNTDKAVNGAFSPLNDAHYFSAAVYDMYNAYLGKPPLPFQLGVRVHYGTDYNNAAWRAGAKSVIFGDGNSKYYPWAVMDIVSHEVSHGFTDQVSGLIRGTKDMPARQSAGMDESYSDIAGEALEFYLTGTNDFYVGKNVKKNSTALRNMANPPADGKSIGNASDYQEGMDAHYSSGVYNKAFYLLATKPNWDTKKAFQIFGRANDLYWAPDSTFNQGACGAEQAATDLGYSKEDVTSALGAVGVGCGVVWDSASALGLYGGPIPTFWDSRKTITSGYEPANGMYGFAARASLFRNSGKRYIEFTFLQHTAANVFPYSGGICLSLRDQSVPVKGDCGGVGDWAIRWFTDADTSPVANNNPWFYTKSDCNCVIWGDPGPLDAWRITEGDTIGIAVDLDSGKIWYSLNGVWVGDPATGTAAAFDQTTYGPTTYFAGKSLTPHLYTDFQNISTKIRGGKTEMLYPVPTGFTAWGD